MAEVILINQRPAPGKGIALDTIFKRPPSLGLAYIKASLKEAGHRAEIVNVSSRKEAERAANIYRHCDFVGISGLTFTARGMRETACVFSGREIPVVVGGVHATVSPNSVMEYADFVVVGEGEKHIIKIAEHMDGRKGELRNVLGAERTPEGRWLPDPEERITDLDALPPPDLDDVRQRLHPLVDKMLWPNMPFGVQIATSRGCPFKCSFCQVPLLQGNRIRTHSAEYIGSLLQNYVDSRARNFMMVDDNFTEDAKRVGMICKEIRDRGLDISWFCMSRVDWIIKNRNLISDMARAGCSVVYYGVESASQAILDSYGKRITPKQARQATEILKKAGISTIASVILGSEKDTMDTMKETLAFLDDIKPDYAQISILQQPSVYKEELAEKYNADWVIEEHPNLSSELIETLQSQANIDFYSDRDNLKRMAHSANFKLSPPLSWFGRPLKRCAARTFARLWAGHYRVKLRDSIR